MRGNVSCAPPGSYLTFAVYTNRWYNQDPTVPITAANQEWEAFPIYLSGQGIYNDHSIRAVLHAADGAELATAEVTGVVRSD